MSSWDSSLYVPRKPIVSEFFAYETIGTAITHVMPVEKTDDPELMKALGAAMDAGRVVMDGDSIVSIDGKPVASLEDLKTVFEEPSCSTGQS